MATAGVAGAGTGLGMTAVGGDSLYVVVVVDEDVHWIE